MNRETNLRKNQKDLPIASHISSTKDATAIVLSVEPKFLSFLDSELESIPFFEIRLKEFQSIFPGQFKTYLIYSSSILEIGRASFRERV